MPADKKIIYVVIVIIFYLLTGCDPLHKFKVLSFFFDGVPPVVVDSLPKRDTIAKTALANKKNEPEFYYHPPYFKNECTRCHDKNGGERRLSLLPPALCYRCHQNWGTIFKTLHGPVASGYCLKCHNQHFAPYPKLLIRSGQDLCLFCHNAKQVFQNIVHEHIGERYCTDCHNPHGGGNRGILRIGSCYNCHENWGKKFKTLHGPVASGFCTECHTSHEIKVKKHLLRENQQICYYCHNSKQVLQNAVHSNINNSSCLECHNPHGGENRFILIPKDSADSTYGKNILKEFYGNKKEAILYILNAGGDPIMPVLKNREGAFQFNNLPADRKYDFLLTADSSFAVNEIKIMFTDSTQKVIFATAKRDSTNFFRYEYLPDEKTIEK